MVFQKLFRIFTSKSRRRKRLFSTVGSIIPAVKYLNPDAMDVRNSFLTENRFKEERENLAEELENWIELLNDEFKDWPEQLDKDKTTIYQVWAIASIREAVFQRVLSKGITVALDETRKLETSYRTLESFFRNANTDYIENLTLMNVNKYDSVYGPKFANEVCQYLENYFDRFNLNDSYSLMVMPGYVLVLIDELDVWAKLAFKCKILLITDYANACCFEDMYNDIHCYCDSYQRLQNVVMTANWIVGRESEELSEYEKDDPAFFIPPSAALAGRLYAESANGWSFLNNRELLLLNETKGVRNNLLKSEVAALMDNQVVPMVLQEGRVRTFNTATLYNGDNEIMKEYPFVYLMNWMEKALIKIINDEAFNRTKEKYAPIIKDKYTPINIKSRISDFFRQFNKTEKLFKKIVVGEPSLNLITKICSIEIKLVVDHILLIGYVRDPFCKIRVTYNSRNMLHSDVEIV